MSENKIKTSFNMTYKSLTDYKSGNNQMPWNNTTQIETIDTIDLGKGPLANSTEKLYNTGEKHSIEELETIYDDFEMTDPKDWTSKIGDTLPYSLEGMDGSFNINEIQYIISDTDNYNNFVDKIRNMGDVDSQWKALAKYWELSNYIEIHSIQVPEHIKSRLSELSNKYTIYANIDILNEKHEGYYEQLDLLSSAFQTSVDELRPTVEKLQEEYDMKLLALQNSYSDIDRLTAEAEAIKAELIPLQTKLNSLELQLDTINQQLKERPYEQMRATVSYQEFLFKYNNGEINIKDIDEYIYMSEEQSLMYNYLLEYEGSKTAEQYLVTITDSINKAKGAAEAAEFISTLKMDDEGKLKDDLMNLLGVSGKGFVEGLDTFFEGISNSITDNTDLSVDDYKRMMILQYLQENSDILDEYYNVSSMLGNMAPVIVTSMAVSYATTPAAGSAAGLYLMGISAYGNNKLQARAEGHDIITSSIYALLTATSEVALEKYLGNIPWLSDTASFTLKGLLSEGIEEVLQNWVNIGVSAVVKGENIDWSTIPEEAKESFFYGVLLSAFLTTGQSVVDITIDKVKYKVDVNKTLEYLNENPEADVMDVMSKINGLSIKNDTSTLQGFDIDNIISNNTDIGGENFGKLVANLDLGNTEHLNYIKEYMEQYESSIPAGLLDKINHAIMANSEVTSEINNNADVNTNMNETNNTLDVEENVFDDDYSDYSIEQIMDVPGYKNLSDILLSKAPSEDIRIKLESILYKGGYNGFSIDSGICNKSNPEIEARKRISIAKLMLKNPKTFDVLMKTNVNLFHGTNANALPNILKYGLNSHAESQNLGVEVVTGEKWSRNENNPRNFVSFTDVLPIATGYSTLSPETSASDLAFEVIIGTTVDDVYDSGKVTIRSDVVEVGAEKGIPLDGIKVIGVPSDKVSYVKKLLGDNTNIEVVAIDGINDGLYSNCDFDEWSTMDIDKLNSDLIAKPTSKIFGIEEIKNFVRNRYKMNTNINPNINNNNNNNTNLFNFEFSLKDSNIPKFIQFLNQTYPSLNFATDNNIKLKGLISSKRDNGTYSSFGEFLEIKELSTNTCFYFPEQFNSGVSNAFHRSIEAFNSLSLTTKKNVKEIVFARGNSPMQAYWSSIDPNIGIIPADGGNGITTFYEAAYTSDDKFIKETIFHEGGHTDDQMAVIYNPNKWTFDKKHEYVEQNGILVSDADLVSNSLEWRNAIKADNIWSSPYASRSFQSRPINKFTEDFADAVKNLNVLGATKYTEIFPNRAEILKEIYPDKFK